MGAEGPRADGAAARAAGAVDEAAILADLLALLAVPSITGDETAARDAVAAQMAAAGLEVRTWDADPAVIAADPDFPGSERPRATLPLAAGHLRGDRPGPRLLLVGHTDVVPPGDPAAWSLDPFRPEVRDGRVFGRGACDMKGGLVAAVAATAAVRATVDPGDLAGEVVVVAVPSEEDGGAGMLAAIRAGYVADAAIISEPTRLEIVTVQAGAITFRLEVPGRAAHASTRREGVSALEKLELVHAALRADETVRNAAETRPEMRALGLPYPTIIGTVHGGDWASTVPDRVVAEGRYGVRAGQAAAGAAAELRAVIAAACAADPWLREHPATVEISGGRFSSAEVSADHPLPTGLADAALDVLGRRPPLVGVPYGADMRLLIREGATPTVMFGPGDVRVAHAADEHVSLAEVVACARVLAGWVAGALAGGQATTVGAGSGRVGSGRGPSGPRAPGGE
jgi:acetylornithine deacetylase